MLGNVLGGFIVILVGVNLIGPAADALEGAQVSTGNASVPSNVSGAAATILDLTTIFFAVGVMSTGVSMAIGGLRQSGLI